MKTQGLYKGELFSTDISGLLELFNIEHLPRFLRRPASAFTLADLLPSQHFWFQGHTFVRF